MAAAGCMHVLVGLESVNEASLGRRTNGRTTPRAMLRPYGRSTVRHSRERVMIVGFDNDTLAEFDRIHEFMNAADLWYVNLNLLDAIPGTELHRRIVRRAGGATGPTVHGRHVPHNQLQPYVAVGPFRRLLKYHARNLLLGRPASAHRPLFSSGWFLRPEHNRDIHASDKIECLSQCSGDSLCAANPPNDGCSWNCSGLSGCEKYLRKRSSSSFSRWRESTAVCRHTAAASGVARADCGRDSGPFSRRRHPVPSETMGCRPRHAPTHLVYYYNESPIFSLPTRLNVTDLCMPCVAGSHRNAGWRREVDPVCAR